MTVEELRLPQDDVRLTVTLAEAANLLGISERHLRNLVRQGTVRVVELGARKVIAMSEMHRLLGQAE